MYAAVDGLRQGRIRNIIVAMCVLVSRREPVIVSFNHGRLSPSQDPERGVIAMGDWHCR